ncbi:hypothetical protein BGZ47_006833 [Haplosporangium gracile]|nr:hypothetical protein BGZ47_006833 [Haplosporangium gracile]
MSSTIEEKKEQQPSPQDEAILRRLYFDIIYIPFQDKYDESWDEDLFWVAIDDFKTKAAQAGIEDPLVTLRKIGFKSYEDIRDIMKEGPPKCFREGCAPCIEAAPELSKLAEKHAGQVAVVGVNDEAMFEDKEYDVQKLKEFLEEKKDDFRYTSYIDTHNHARDNVYNPCGYQGIPCLILLVNNVVSYVGSPGEGFERALSNSLDAVAMEREE